MNPYLLLKAITFSILLVPKSSNIGALILFLADNELSFSPNDKKSISLVKTTNPGGSELVDRCVLGHQVVEQLKTATNEFIISYENLNTTVGKLFFSEKKETSEGQSINIPDFIVNVSNKTFSIENHFDYELYTLFVKCNQLIPLVTNENQTAKESTIEDTIWNEYRFIWPENSTSAVKANARLTWQVKSDFDFSKINKEKFACYLNEQGSSVKFE